MYNIGSSRGMKLQLELEQGIIDGLDYNEICRFCLSNEGILLPIFGSKEICNEVLPHQIKTILTVELSENDGLPSLICHSCLFNLERSIEFKKQCEEADSFLRSHSSHPSVNKHEEHDSSQLATSEDIPKDDVKQAKPQHDEAIDEKGNYLNVNTEVSSYSNDDSKEASENQIDSDQEKCLDNDNKDVENNALQMEERMNDIEEEIYGSKPFSLDLCSIRLQSEGQDETIMYPTGQLTDEDQWTESGSELSDELELIEATSSGNCPGCNKAFSSSADLERHQLIHKQEPPYPCDYCDQNFEEKLLLKAHWRSHARNKSHMCHTCGEAYSDRAELIKHSAMHDIIKPYHCQDCGKAFAYRSDLRKHAIIHTGVRPYKCPICNKTFTRSTNLNKHARVHTGRRPYPCDNCDKMFSTRGDLVRHSVIHTGEKPYACLICSLAFNRKDKLSRHERVHITDRPFACAECPTSFHRKEELTKHSRFHHFKPDPEFYNTPDLGINA